MNQKMSGTARFTTDSLRKQQKTAKKFTFKTAWSLLMVLMCSRSTTDLFTIMGSFDNCALRMVTYNRRGLNDTKKLYVNQILAGCDILFLQEHWQSDDQLGCFNSISSEHASVGVSGFSNCDVLRGRPYGGCAIFWRKALQMSVTQIPTNSRRVCAILMHGACMIIMYLCLHAIRKRFCSG